MGSCRLTFCNTNERYGLLISGSKVRALVRPPSKPLAPRLTEGAAALRLFASIWVGRVGPMIASRHAMPNENLPQLGTIVVLPTLLSGAWIWEQQIDVFRELCPNIVEFADPLVRWPVAPELSALDGLCSQPIGRAAGAMAAGGKFVWGPDCLAHSLSSSRTRMGRWSLAVPGAGAPPEGTSFTANPGCRVTICTTSSQVTASNCNSAPGSDLVH